MPTMETLERWILILPILILAAILGSLWKLARMLILVSLLIIALSQWETILNWLGQVRIRE